MFFVKIIYECITSLWWLLTRDQYLINIYFRNAINFPSVSLTLVKVEWFFGGYQNGQTAYLDLSRLSYELIWIVLYFIEIGLTYVSILTHIYLFKQLAYLHWIGYDTIDVSVLLLRSFFVKSVCHRWGSGGFGAKWKKLVFSMSQVFRGKMLAHRFLIGQPLEW